MDDVERNGRVFSDGVGTCSWEVLKMLQQRRSQTLFLPRFSRFATLLCSASPPVDNQVQRNRRVADRNCGVALRMLPLVLNRPSIKILEDLGIPNQAFENLQLRAIDELRGRVSSITNAAAFLEKNNVGKSTHTNCLLRKMQSLGLALSDDLFFRDLLDAVVLIQLQDLKYKTRIPVKEGVTLYGIMDETGYLEEGEVYCCRVDMKGHIKRAPGTVVMSRSPARHPGDVQMAKAIAVQNKSPLRALHNCITFSSKGQRDLLS
ncbi:MAG: hypothetical protein Q9213_007175 [Squamulea squamosa]